MEISTLIDDLKVLYKSAEEDYQNKQYSAYEDFLHETNSYIDKLIELDAPIEGINKIKLVPDGQKGMYGMIGSHAEMAKHREVINTLKKIIQRCGSTNNDSDIESLITNLESIFSNFHQVVKQLRSRYNSRPTIDVEDEYDVQDLLHALLKVHFEDIRTEENSPSYAGGSKRLDFLLKNEKIVIEVKKTRKGLNDKKVGEELLIDISTYSAHPYCELLYCFVYDPEGRVTNPKGLKNDLEKKTNDQLKVKVWFNPE